jgi:protocatechuate 3,4-dioxygenase beta subunit
VDHDDATVGRILTRREAIIIATRVGVVLAGAGPAGCARSSPGQGADGAVQPGPVVAKPAPVVVSPSVTEGPFFVDEKLNRSDLVAGTSRASVVNGLPLALAFVVHKVDGDSVVPLRDVWVDVWHADTAGVYSDESDGMNREDTAGQKWLRGYQVTGEDGRVGFTTIFPGWYASRTPHIHFKIRRLDASGKSGAEFTSQVFFSEQDIERIYAKEPYVSTGERDTSNQTDDVFNERLSDGSVAGSHLLLDLTKSPGPGYAAEFSVVLTDESMRPGRRGPGRGPRGGPPGRRPPRPLGPPLGGRRLGDKRRQGVDWGVAIGCGHGPAPAPL